MTLQEMIYRRKSVRSYTGAPVDLPTMRKIESFASGLKPLYPEIRVRYEIVGRENVRCILPWITPQLIAVFTEDKDGAMENVGFMFQQLDLYIQSLGLGVCWLGMGRLSSQQAAVENSKNDGLKFCMMLAFGHPKGSAQRESLGEFKRKSPREIADRQDERLEPARFAPSSVNSQPWYFVHDGETIHAHCVQQGFLKARAMGDMNRIDMGIALAHMYIANPDSFRFFRAENVQKVKGYGYIGSFTL